MLAKEYCRCEVPEGPFCRLAGSSLRDAVGPGGPLAPPLCPGQEAVTDLPEAMSTVVNASLWGGLNFLWSLFYPTTLVVPLPHPCDMGQSVSLTLRPKQFLAHQVSLKCGHEGNRMHQGLLLGAVGASKTHSGVKMELKSRVFTMPSHSPSGVLNPISICQKDFNFLYFCESWK